MAKTSRLGLVALMMLGALGMVGARCGGPVRSRPAPRVVSTLPGTCDGRANYADELALAELTADAVTPFGIGMAEVEIDVSLRNDGSADFRSASAVPDLASDGAADLGILADSVLAADFGPVAPGETVTSTTSLLLQLPLNRLTDLLDRLESGELPLVVHADEVNVLADGVTVREWGALEDRMYFLASSPSGGWGGPVNADPGAGPFAPGQEFTVAFLEFSDSTTTVFDSFVPTVAFYLTEDPDAPFVNLPDAYSHVRVVAAERQDEDGDDFTLWLVTLKRTDQESLPAIWSTASFCTGTDSHLDPDIQATRVGSLYGEDEDDPDRDSHEQPLRVNRLEFQEGVVTVSGQIAGHVLKPSLSLRLRDGQVQTGVDFDTDLSFTAEVKAEDDVSWDPEDTELWTLCYPLPSLPAGPVSIPMNLQLLHTVGLQAELAAGVAVGFSKHFSSGFSIRCHGGAGPDDCTSEGHREGTPIEFTPPHLTDSTHASARVETTLVATLRIGSEYPVCDAGMGVGLTTTAFGEMNVQPTQEPWWDSSYGLEVDAFVELELLGLDLARYEGDLTSWLDGASSSDVFPAAGDPGARTSGLDQRWAVAIDQTAVPNGTSSTKIVALPDGSSLTIGSEAIGGRNPLVKLDRFGALVWVKNFPKKVLALHLLPDGTVIAGGSGNAWLARLDADGNLLWSYDAQIGRAAPTTARCALHDVAALEQAPGVYDYVVVGAMGTGLVTTTDACAFRVGEDGLLDWSRVYVGTAVQDFDAIIATRDGEVAVGGSDHWSWAGNRAIPVFVKLDADTGDVLWAKGLPMTRGAGLHALTEAVDGTLFGAGDAMGTILTSGHGVVARIGADGGDPRTGMLLQDEEWEAQLDYESWIDTAGGDTAYDVFFDIAPSGDGFAVVGRTGLGTGTAARVAKINRNLGVEWFRTFDGAGAEGLAGIAPAPDGLFVSGWSESLPEADGGTGETQLWVMKLPVTGAVELLPEVGMTARFVEPGVRNASDDTGVNPSGQRSIDMTYTTEPGVFVSGAANPGLVVAASAYCVELLTETGAPTTTDACPE